MKRIAIVCLTLSLALSAGCLVGVVIAECTFTEEPVRVCTDLGDPHYDCWYE